MATPVGVTHAFASGLSDGPDPTQVQPSNWNAQHVLGGTAFPIGPSAGQLWFHDTYQQWFRFDGTRWLSTTKFQCGSSLQFSNLSASDAGSPRIPVPQTDGASDIWIENYEMGFNVSGGTALSTSNHWLVAVQSVAVGGAPTTLFSFDINSGASSAWRQTGPTAVGALLGSPTGFSMIDLVATKTGTPGNLYCYVSFTYRIVAT